MPGFRRSALDLDAASTFHDGGMPHETVNQQAADDALPQPGEAASTAAIAAVRSVPEQSVPAQSVPEQSAALAVSGLRKSFGEKLVLDGIDLSVPAGTVFALLG